jgi:hypothetical protein
MIHLSSLVYPKMHTLFDYLSVAALFLMAVGVWRQWRHVAHTGSARDIAFSEVAIRFGITAILLVKMIFVGDRYLIIGQAIFLISMTAYIITLTRIKFKQ